jgi:hypothetical protein
VREVQLAAEPMPPGAIQQQDGMRASRDMAADLNQMQVHRLGIGLRQDKGCAGAARRTDRAEDVGPVIALIARRRRPGALFRPDVGQAALLADACFILPPELDRLAAGLGGMASATSDAKFYGMARPSTRQRRLMWATGGKGALG